MQPTNTPRLGVNESGSFEIRWREGGVAKRRSLRTKEREVAERELGAVLLGHVRQEDYTVAQAWLLRKSETLSQVVDSERIENCWKALLPFFGARRVSSLKTADFHNYLAARMDAGRAASTVRRELVELAATLKLLVREKRLSAEKIPCIPLPPSAAARPRFLTEEECRAVLGAAARKREGNGLYRRLELFLWLGLNTGQRKRAIETLMWDQVDFDEGVIHFAKIGERQTKKRKASVPMRKQLKEFLLAEYERRDSDWVLGTSGSVRTSFETLVLELELQEVTHHTLRHTFISHLLIAKEPVFTVSQIVGVSVAQIERTYGHLTKGHMRDSVENALRY
jgi:integrase